VEIDDSFYKEIFDSRYSIALINVASPKSHHSLNKVSRPEANVIVEILGDLLNHGILPNQVGIIAPFRAQVAEIRRLIELNLFSYFKRSEDIKPIVDTVDRFQGDERDVIIFSLTLIDENIPELLQDIRRLNVAISRARKKFIGVGNWDNVGGSETLMHLKEYVEQSDKSILINSSEICNLPDGIL
jgi:DNA replication ATP-dependent helicase Dna2